jgi:hypothetical protein
MRWGERRPEASAAKWGPAKLERERRLTEITAARPELVKRVAGSACLWLRDGAAYRLREAVTADGGGSACLLAASRSAFAGGLVMR